MKVLRDKNRIMAKKRFYVYLLTNYHNTVIYTGVTNNLERRILEHKNKVNRGFTSKYNVYKLVYFEEFKYILNAIAREKQIKAGSRAKKISLIESVNKEWRELQVVASLRSQ
jgi:putative endonuclease